MQNQSAKQTFMLLAELMEAYADFIVRIGEVERKGLPLKLFYNPEYWGGIGKKLFNELSKEDFIALMEVIYELGKLSALNVEELTAGEKTNLGQEIKRYAERIKGIMRGAE